MTVLVEDLREGARIISTLKGKQRVEVKLLEGVAGTGDEIINNALSDALVPEPGDAHDVETSLSVLQVATRAPFAVNTVELEITYGTPDPSDLLARSNLDVVDWSMDTSLINDTTLQDKTGTDMSVSYSGVGVGGVTARSVIVEAEIQKPALSITITRVEDTAPTTTREGTVNDASITILGRTYTARTLLMARVNITPIKGSTKVLVTYGMQHKPDTWDFVAKVKIGGQVPSDATFTSNNGLLSAEIYEDESWTALSLPSAIP